MRRPSQQPRRQKPALQPRLHRQPLAQRLRDDGAIEQRSADASIAFGGRQRDQPQLGQLAPPRAIQPAWHPPDGMAACDIHRRTEALDRVAEHRLVIGQIEIHARFANVIGTSTKPRSNTLGATRNSVPGFKAKSSIRASSSSNATAISLRDSILPTHI